MKVIGQPYYKFSFGSSLASLEVAIERKSSQSIICQILEVAMASSFNQVISDGLPVFMSIISFLIVRWFIKSFSKSKSNVFPPSPPALPIIGHLYLLSSRLPESLQNLANRYGPLMRIRIGASAFVVVSNATVAKEIFKAHDIDFSSRYEPGPTEYNIYKGTGFVTGPYGAYWRFMKKLCATKLLAGAQLDRFNHIREQEIERLLRSLMKSSREGAACDLGLELAAMANNVTFRMTMSKKFSENASEAKRMRKSIVEIMELAGKFGINELFGFLKKIDLFGKGKNLREALWRYDALLEEIMKDYEDNEMNGRENADRDLMDILLETYRDVDAEVKLTRNQIKHFLLVSP